MHSSSRTQWNKLGKQGDSVETPVGPTAGSTTTTVRLSPPPGAVCCKLTSPTHGRDLNLLFICLTYSRTSASERHQRNSICPVSFHSSRWGITYFPNHIHDVVFLPRLLKNFSHFPHLMIIFLMVRLSM